MKTALVICDLCGRRLLSVKADGSFVHEEATAIMLDGHIFDVCAKCEEKPIRVLVEKRRVVFEQNAGLESWRHTPGVGGK